MRFRATLQRWTNAAQASIDLPGAIKRLGIQTTADPASFEPLDTVVSHHLAEVLGDENALRELATIAAARLPSDHAPMRVVCERTIGQMAVSAFSQVTSARHHPPRLTRTVDQLLTVTGPATNQALQMALALGGTQDPVVIAQRIPGDDSSPSGICAALLATNSRSCEATLASFEQRGLCTPITTMAAMQAGAMHRVTILHPHTIGFALRGALWQQQAHQRSGAGWWNESYDFRWRRSYDGLPDLLLGSSAILAQGNRARREHWLQGLSCGDDSLRTRTWMADRCVSLMTSGVPELTVAACDLLTQIEHIGS